MPKVDVQKVDKDNPPLVSFSQEIRDAFERIPNKAFELFELRGGEPGKELDDWFQAERNLFWVPQAELTETGAEFRIEVGVPGLDAKDIQVNAEPDAILVLGQAQKHSEKYSKTLCYSEFGEKSLYRRFDLMASIDVDRVTANVDNGMLTVIAPIKAVAEQKKKEERRETAVAA